MKDKMNKEEADRLAKEEEMNRKLREQQEASENEVIQLYKVIWSVPPMFQDYHNIFYENLENARWKHQEDQRYWWAERQIE